MIQLQNPTLRDWLLWESMATLLSLASVENKVEVRRCQSPQKEPILHPASIPGSRILASIKQQATLDHLGYYFLSDFERHLALVKTW